MYYALITAFQTVVLTTYLQFFLAFQCGFHMDNIKYWQWRHGWKCGEIVSNLLGLDFIFKYFIFQFLLLDWAAPARLLVLTEQGVLYWGGSCRWQAAVYSLLRCWLILVEGGKSADLVNHSLPKRHCSNKYIFAIKLYRFSIFLSPLWHLRAQIHT